MALARPSLYYHTLSDGGSSTGPPCTQTSQPSYSPPPTSSPAPVHSVRGLDVVLRLGALAAEPPFVVPNMVSKTRGIGRQLFVERLTVPGPPGPWPRFCCLTWAAHDMFQHFLDPAGIKWPMGLPTYLVYNISSPSYVCFFKTTHSSVLFSIRMQN